MFTLVATSSRVLLAFGPSPRTRPLAWLLCLLDAALVTTIVSATGGARSVLVFLYVLLVTAASVLLSRGGALAVACACSALYAALVLMQGLVPALASGSPVEPTTATDLLAILVNSATLVIVATVAGGLAERFIASQREVASQRLLLGDLRVFSEVILQSTATGLVALDRDHRVTAFNRAAEAMTGTPAAAALGARWVDLFGPGLPLGEIEAAIAHDRDASTRHEADLRRADGGTLPVRVTGSALDAGDGTRLGLIAALEDLSAVRALEARMRQADRLATLGRLAANIAHEIRNPLAALSGASEVLVDPGTPAESRDRLARIVRRESDRLSETLGNFLEYAHPAPLVVEAVDATAVVDEVLRALAPADVRVVRAMPAALPVEADRERLRQALWNLCASAVSAMPGGGELRVAGGRRAGAVELSLADTGQRVRPQDLPHVFEPFFASRGGGAGLGLAVVHRIVAEHGGEVTVRSESGLGTEFTLRLPDRRG